MEEETGEVQVQAKECQGLPAGSRIQERDRGWSSLQGFQKEPKLGHTLVLDSGPRAVRESISIVLGHLVYDNLLEQP